MCSSLKYPVQHVARYKKEALAHSITKFRATLVVVFFFNFCYALLQLYPLLVCSFGVVTVCQLGSHSCQSLMSLTCCWCVFIQFCAGVACKKKAVSLCFYFILTFLIIANYGKMGCKKLKIAVKSQTALNNAEGRIKLLWTGSVDVH